MSSSIDSKLYFILEKIEDIESFRNRYQTIEAMLDDNMGFDATLMCLLQIGETLHKLRESAYRDLLPIKGSYDVRNFIAHDYEGVNKTIIENTIRTQLPLLKQTIQSILKDL